MPIGMGESVGRNIMNEEASPTKVCDTKTTDKKSVCRKQKTLSKAKLNKGLIYRQDSASTG